MARVTITDGDASGDVGGGVLVQGVSTSLVLSDAAVTNNVAEQGGGLANINARLDVVRSTINDNEVSDDTFESEGGGIYSDGANAVTTVTDSTISGNSAISGESSAKGGAITVFDGSLTARNVTFAGNTAGHAGDPTGGLGGTSYIDSDASVTISNTIVDALGPLVCLRRVVHARPQRRGRQQLRDARQEPADRPAPGQRRRHEHARDRGKQARAVDAGANCSGADQRGQLRRRACDAGAYEFQGTPTPPSGGGQPPPPPPDEELPDPVPHKNVNAVPESGTVKIKLPGATSSSSSTEGQQIPLGTIVDARKGRVMIVAASGNGQTADFYAGIFKLSQTKGAKPITVLTLVEKLTCPKSKASAAAKKKKKRRLWGDGKGRFRTKGKHSAATVVGTKWLVEDKCTSTLTRVVRGKVRVRDFVKEKNVLVRPARSTWRRRRDEATPPGRGRRAARPAPAASADVTVTTALDDDDGVCDAQCTLREAIVHTTSGEVVTLPARTYDVLDELFVSHDLTIRGAGARTTTIRYADALQRRSGHERRRGSGDVRSADHGRAQPGPQAGGINVQGSATLT